LVRNWHPRKDHTFSNSWKNNTCKMLPKLLLNFHMECNSHFTKIRFKDKYSANANLRLNFKCSVANKYILLQQLWVAYSGPAIMTEFYHFQFQEVWWMELCFYGSKPQFVLKNIFNHFWKIILFLFKQVDSSLYSRQYWFISELIILISILISITWC
jgi:hypothetical protein